MKPSDMTDEQIRIRVADILGCREQRKLSGTVHYDPDDSGTPRTYQIRRDGSTAFLPDWPHDLNACHEMEKAMPEDRRGSYALHLLESCGVSLLYENRLVNNLALFAIAAATPRQRCEAFVEVMSK